MKIFLDLRPCVARIFDESSCGPYIDNAARSSAENLFSILLILRFLYFICYLRLPRKIDNAAIRAAENLFANSALSIFYT